MNVTLTSACQICDGDPRFCSCHKGSVNNSSSSALNHHHPSQSIPHKPTKKKKDMMHCTICHVPKAKHVCSLVPCLDPANCGKPRLHRKQGNRGYHDTIVTSIFTSDQNLDQNPTKKRQRATSEAPGNWGIPRQYQDYDDPLDSPPGPSIVAPNGEEDRTRDFIVSLSDFIASWDPCFATAEGKMMSLKLASMTHTHMLGMKRSMKKQAKSKKDEMDYATDEVDDEKSAEDHLDVLHHTFEDHASHVYSKEEHDNGIHEEEVVEHSLTGFNLTSQGLSGYESDS